MRNEITRIALKFLGFAFAATMFFVAACSPARAQSPIRSQLAIPVVAERQVAVAASVAETPVSELVEADEREAEPEPRDVWVRDNLFVGPTEGRIAPEPEVSAIGATPSK